MQLKSFTFAAVFYASFSPVAAAHCYSVWHYHTPQHCGHGTMRVHSSSRELPPPAPDNDWFVEIINLPPDERNQAIDKLKGLMK